MLNFGFLIGTRAMDCDNCHERPATTHITGEPAMKGDFCAVCFPSDLSESEHQAKIRQLFLGPSRCTGREHSDQCWSQRVGGNARFA
jgi:hypothetical protein